MRQSARTRNPKYPTSRSCEKNACGQQKENGNRERKRKGGGGKTEKKIVQVGGLKVQKVTKKKKNKDCALFLKLRNMILFVL